MVNGHLHAVAALSPRKEPPVRTWYEAGWAPELVWMTWRKTVYFWFLFSFQIFSSVALHSPSFRILCMLLRKIPITSAAVLPLVQKTPPFYLPFHESVHAVNCFSTLVVYYFIPCNLIPWNDHFGIGNDARWTLKAPRNWTVL